MVHSGKTILLTLKQTWIIFFPEFSVKEIKLIVIIDKAAQMML